MNSSNDLKLAIKLYFQFMSWLVLGCFLSGFIGYGLDIYLGLTPKSPLRSSFWMLLLFAPYLSLGLIQGRKANGRLSIDNDAIENFFRPMSRWITITIFIGLSLFVLVSIFQKFVLNIN